MGLLKTAKAAIRRWHQYSGTSQTRKGNGLPYSFASEPVQFKHSAISSGSVSKRINWVIPDFHASSGGHRTIFRLTRALEGVGYKVRFHIFGDTHYVSEAEATEAMRKYYFPLKATVQLGVAQMAPSEICMASSWETAYPVRDFNACRRKIYFVQDFEPSFFPASTGQTLAQATYGFGFECFCAGPWLAQQMRTYTNHAESFDLAYDPEIYFAEPNSYQKRRVVFYARHETPRRGTELGLLALALLKASRPETEIVIFGSNNLRYELPFEFTAAGILTEHELAELYRSATVGLSLSLTNYSLIPQEMMACGLPVVEMDLPPLRTAYPMKTAGIHLARPTPQEIAGALARVLALTDSEIRKEREAALLLVKDLSWSRAGKSLIDFLEH
jgi:glycosyltransferase involved in cell wall biosynthesis